MPTVIIYSTSTCPYCQMAKMFLKQHNIAYTERNVAEDMQAQKEMIEKSKQMGVPVIDIDGEIVIGFDKKRMKELLKID
jgi:glutaredoxin-like YruB-family protein